jgi:SAM-dependent methyltransferase
MHSSSSRERSRQVADLSKRREAQIYSGTARLPAPAGKKTALWRLLTDRAYATRVIRYFLRLPVPLNTQDRRVLEQVIFQHFLRLPDTNRTLFVGCDWYTKHYERTFFRDREYWTIDASAKARKFGARRHLVADLEKLEHFPERYFDVLYCNGVYGFGLDAAPDKRAVEMCWSRLRDGGYFIFGWNDIPARTPVPSDAIVAFRRFRRLSFPEFNSWRYLTDTPYRHTYDFYIKADA